MFSNLSPGLTVFANFILMLLWHIVALVICINLDQSFFSPLKSLYLPRQWEKNGHFYVSTLKIKKWKDCLPQYISKKGFSKRHLNQISKLNEEYIQRFIIETCRAEWNHFICAFYWIISFSVNSFYYGLIFSLISIFANLPFISIQRYNRFRLQRLVRKHKCTQVEKVESISI